MHGTIQDITDRKQVEDALLDSHDVLNSILSTTRDGFWRVDSRGYLLGVNPAYCHQSGYSRKELVGMPISMLEEDLNAADIALRIQGIIENGDDLFETRHRRKNGSIWSVEVSASCHNETSGEFFVFLRDITERKQTAAVIEKRIVALTRPVEGGEI
ncbi:PAS domain S-box protein, partial [bacterium]|nr:PAS domain S-box protein [bacterium]